MSFLRRKARIESSHTQGEDTTVGEGLVTARPISTAPVLPYKPEPISVIIPTLNEAANIAELLTRLIHSMDQANIPYEVIVVDDHSTDNTVLIVESLAKQGVLPIRVLMKQGRAGKSFSLMEGFAAAQFDILAMIDGDLQYPPEVLPTMAQQLMQADIVVADRRTTYNNANQLRGSLSSIFTSVVSLLFGINTDMQSGMKMFRRTIYDRQVIQSGQWSLDLYLVTYAVFNGYRLRNVPIDYQKRHGGESKVVPFKVAIELLQTTLQLKVSWTLHYVRNILASAKNKVNGSSATPIEQSYNRLPSEASVGARLVPALTAENSEMVRDYTTWLLAEETNNNSISFHEETYAYIDAAIQKSTIKGRAVRTFAPFH